MILRTPTVAALASFFSLFSLSSFFPLVACSHATTRDHAAVPDAGQDTGAPVVDGAGDVVPPDASGDGGPLVTLSLALHRADGGSPSPIDAVVRAVDSLGTPVDGLAVSLDFGATSVAAAGQGSGEYRATITPPFTSGELPVTARLSSSDAGVTRTALVLPFVNGPWDQPQPVAGLVNTPGTEDSSTVSPDGRWLIVATYSPVDLLCCNLGCGGYSVWDGRNPVCSDVIGPTGAPARPGMPGADRVLSSTSIDFADPVMCAEEPDGGPVQLPDDGGTYPFALPPVAVYGFQRQADGSYAQPFLIDVGADGFVSEPFCLTFLGTGAPGDTVDVVFGYNVDAPGNVPPHPWLGQISLGETTSLGSYACQSSTLPAYPSFTPKGIAPLPVGPATQQAGNTSEAKAGDGGFYLFSDNESVSPKSVEYSWSADGGAYSNWAPVALPSATSDESQPVAFAGKLYYHLGNDVASVDWNGGDPANAGSFSAPAKELTADSNPTDGGVIAVGQPTFATVDGGAAMFFVYYLQAGSGTNGQIGVVPHR